MKNASGKKILIIEDDVTLLKILADKLTALGYTVFKAEDGKSAIDLCIQKYPDLILLDLLLPEIDGYGVLETVRNYGDKKISELPVIVLSNLWSDKDILRAKALRIEEYYVKAQTNLEDVYLKVAKILNI